MLEARLRWLRRRVFLHTLARDLTARATFAEVVQTMTTLAERALRDAIELHAQALRERYGTPLGGSSGAPQRLIVVAMGKLGGGELNVSSDIDLVFVYPEEGETDGLERDLQPRILRPARPADRRRARSSRRRWLRLSRRHPVAAVRRKRIARPFPSRRSNAIW